MLKKDLLDHIIYVAKFQIATGNCGSGLSYFQKQYGAENIIHTHDKKIVINPGSSYLTNPDLKFEEVTDVDTLNWFFKCIETGIYTELFWIKSSISNSLSGQ